MQIFVYEFITGGGLLRAGDSEAELSALRDEGLAMFAAIATDLAQLTDVQVVGLWDERLSTPQRPIPAALQLVSSQREHQKTFDRLAASADATLLIVPESDGELTRAAARVLDVGGRLLGPDPGLIALASNKDDLSQHLAKDGIPVPRGVAFSAPDPLPDDFPYPAVMKPIDGAGALQTYLVKDAEQAHRLRPDGPVRLEAFHHGLPASVAFLCGPAGQVALPPCRQNVQIEQGVFHYLGGSLPLPSELAARATRIARNTIQCLPSPRGYLGVDLILGEASSGEQDIILEVNPRLTTSYVGLRESLSENLAGMMLDLLNGRPATLCGEPKPLEFSADGRVWPAGDSKSNESHIRAGIL